MRVVAAAFVPFAAILVLAIPVAAQHAGAGLFAASKQARRGGYHMLLRQFRADEPTLGEHSDAGQKPAVAQYQDARDIPAGYWVWQRPYWFVFRDGPRTVPQGRAWGPEAACGVPDYGQRGNPAGAWATQEADAKGEWLLLEYAAPVRIAAVEVHESHNPGAIAAIAVLTPRGDEVEVWSSREAKPPTEPSRVLKIPLPPGFEVERIKLTLRSDAVPGWNEIDAVGLEDLAGRMHWAKFAEASSTYADLGPQAGPPGGPRAGNMQVLLGGLAVRAVQPLNVPIQPLQVRLPRVAMPAVQMPARLQQVVFQVARPADAEKEQLQKQVAELEAKVKALEAELARAKAAVK